MRRRIYSERYKEIRTLRWKELAHWEEWGEGREIGRGGGDS